MRRSLVVMMCFIGVTPTTAAQEQPGKVTLTTLDRDTGKPVACRVHLKDTLGDVVGIRDRALGWPLRSAMQRIAQEGHGVIVILRPDETPRDLMDAVQSIGRDPAAEPG